MPTPELKLKLKVKVKVKEYAESFYSFNSIIFISILKVCLYSTAA